jgi:predicted SAM-dependent methyltransferase
MCQPDSADWAAQRLQPVRLDLGSGEDRLVAEDGIPYVRVDIREDVAPDIRADARHLGMFGDCSVDEILASHVLEHFPFAEALTVLSEWHRVLRPQGTLDIHVPNLRAICHMLTTGDLPIEQAVPDIFGGQEHEYDFHYSGYDCERLSELLGEAGFETVLTEVGGEIHVVSVKRGGG